MQNSVTGHIYGTVEGRTYCNNINFQDFLETQIKDVCDIEINNLLIGQLQQTHRQVKSNCNDMGLS